MRLLLLSRLECGGGRGKVVCNESDALFDFPFLPGCSLFLLDACRNDFEAGHLFCMAKFNAVFLHSRAASTGVDTLTEVAITGRKRGVILQAVALILSIV